MRHNRLEKCIKYLEVENIISKGKDGRYFRTINEWEPDLCKSERITKQRYEELNEMKQFVDLNRCYMQFIAHKLDDPYAKECGKCSVCTGKKYFPTSVDQELALAAVKFLRGQFIVIEKRKQWPAGIMDESQKKISTNYQVEDGRALCNYGDAGWGKFIHDDKYVNNYFREELVDATVELILDWLHDNIKHMYLAYIPSLRKPELVKSFAYRVAKKLNIPCLDIIKKKKKTQPQKELENSVYQCQNAFESFSVRYNCCVCCGVFVADSMEKKIRKKETREAIIRKQSLILSSYRPDMPFQAYAAMERNKYVYAFSDFVVIISSDYNKGGTWAGATENWKHGWVPMFVRKEDEIPQGNISLLKKENVYPITQEVISDETTNIYEWFKSQSKRVDKNKPYQISWFEYHTVK